MLEDILLQICFKEFFIKHRRTKKNTIHLEGGKGLDLSIVMRVTVENQINDQSDSNIEP